MTTTATTRQTPDPALRDLTAWSHKNDGKVVFEDTIIRFASDGQVWLMNREVGGWGQRGYPYASLWTLAKDWKLTFLTFGYDDCSRFIRVAPGHPALRRES